jgi:two-component system OmpR family response regulator
MKILLIEDDEETAAYVLNGLSEAGHLGEHCPDGRDGLVMATTEDYDVLIVDRMLPGLDGLGLVKTLRSAGVTSPVLFLTAIGGIDDRVEGLDAGGDDYLVKPFAFSELLARVAALGRRPPMAAEETVLKVADLEVNLIQRAVSRGGREIELRPREFHLLEYLLRNAGKVVTRTMLLERVWDFNFDPRTNVVETHISRLRGKIDRPFDEKLIKTVHGVGYTIDKAR